MHKWQTVDNEQLGQLIDGLTPRGQQRLIMVDGRSGNGKTTFAHKLMTLFDAALIHTDDVSWHLHPTDWVQEILEGVIGPWQRGVDIAYKPPGWTKMGREGLIEAPAKPMLIIEGVGAGRAELATYADLVTWVQAGTKVAYSRGIARDVKQGRTQREAEEFWVEWMSVENPFLASDRPWTRARLIVNGAPSIDSAGTTQIAFGPLSSE